MSFEKCAEAAGSYFLFIFIITAIFHKYYAHGFSITNYWEYIMFPLQIDIYNFL